MSVRKWPKEMLRLFWWTIWPSDATSKSATICRSGAASAHTRRHFHDLAQLGSVLRALEVCRAGLQDDVAVEVAANFVMQMAYNNKNMLQAGMMVGLPNVVRSLRRFAADSRLLVIVGDHDRVCCPKKTEALVKAAVVEASSW